MDGIIQYNAIQYNTIGTDMIPDGNNRQVNLEVRGLVEIRQIIHHAMLCMTKLKKQQASK